MRMGSRALPLTKVTHLQMFTHLFSLCFDSDRSVEAFIAPHLCMQTKGAGIPVDLSAEASSCREPGRSRAEHRCRLPRAWCLAGNIHDFRRRGHMCLASSVCVPGHSEGDLVDRGSAGSSTTLGFQNLHAEHAVWAICTDRRRRQSSALRKALCAFQMRGKMLQALHPNFLEMLTPEVGRQVRPHRWRTLHPSVAPLGASPLWQTQECSRTFSSRLRRLSAILALGLTTLAIP